MTSDTLFRNFSMNGCVKIKGPSTNFSLTFIGDEISIDVTKLDSKVFKVIVDPSPKKVMLKRFASLLTKMKKTLVVSLKGDPALVLGHKAAPGLLSKVGLLPDIEVKNFKASTKLIRGLYNEF